MKDKTLKVGDYVTRKKYGNDIIFKVYKIEGKKIYLKGKDVRLLADCNLEDITIINVEKVRSSFRPKKKLDINKYFYIPGKVLHIDSDSDYILQCEEFYKKNNICYKSLLISEEKLPEEIEKINNLIEYDVVIITGHDAYYKNKKTNKSYLNSEYFIDCVKKIRRINKSIVIVCGACQSDYENLIKAGSTFASSPSKVNIHALDPAIIATEICLEPVNHLLDAEELINKTYYGSNGMGGISSFGTMKIGFPRKGD